MIEDTILYVKHFIEKTKQEHPETIDTILKSALVYQYLYHKHFEKELSIDEILELNNGEIGLIGPGNSCITHLFERMFRDFEILHSHSILHDAFGRFYNDYSLDRGYTYVIPKRFTPKRLKKSALGGQISGLIYCAHTKLRI